MTIRLGITFEGTNLYEVHREMELLGAWLGWLAFAAPIGPVPECLLRLNKKVKNWLERYEREHNFQENRIWNMHPPKDVPLKSHYHTFGFFLSFLQNKIYERTAKYIPDTLVISPCLWPVIEELEGWEALPKERLLNDHSPKRLGKLVRHRLTVWADARRQPGGELYYVGNKVRHPETTINFKVIEEEPGKSCFPMPDEECPLCKNGTVGFEEGELRCRGECGTVWKKPLSPAWLEYTGQMLHKLKPDIEAACAPPPPLPSGERKVSYYEPVELIDMVGNKKIFAKEVSQFPTGKAFHNINAANIRKMFETEMTVLTMATAGHTVPELEGRIRALLGRILRKARPAPEVEVKEKKAGGIDVLFKHPNTDSYMTKEELYAYMGLMSEVRTAKSVVQPTCATGELRPIETAPKDGTYILLFGPSGYVTTPLRCEVCRYDAEFRPLQPWVNHANDSFTDGGGAPTHWLPLPGVPEE